MIDNITARLRYCSSLPTIPGIAMRIIDLANQPEVNMTQISDYVSMDPALSAKFLKVARSPLYMTRRTATNVRQAISLMGTHASIMIALSFSLVHSMRIQKDKEQRHLELFWRRSLIAALAARALGEKLGYKKLDDLFLAGLLQDVGVLAFDALMPEAYETISRRALTHDDLLQAERKTFGAGHDEVGYWLLKHWKLPDYLALSCLAYHSLSHEKDAMSRMTACVAVAGHIADHFLHPGDPQVKRVATQTALECLDMNEASFGTVLDAVAARMPEAEELFDIRLLNPVEIDAIMKEARDLQTLRQLSKDLELERGALRDGLTGAYNRNYLDNVLQREFELASRNTWPLSLAMIDLDHLKNINDLYGHQVGDAILVAIVQKVQSQIRPDDIFARYIGESFVLVMPGASREHAHKVLGRLLESIGNLEHAHDRGTPIKITVSIGAATHMDGGTTFERAEEMIGATEAALLQAKHNGRNRISLWQGH